MAIGRNSLLTSTAVTSPGTSTTTASVSNTANAVLLLAIATGQTGGSSPPTAVTGLGLTWVRIATVVAGNMENSVWRALGAASTGTIQITWAAGTAGAIYQLDEFTGVDTSGTNGSGAIRQSNTSSANTNAPTLTLASSPLTGNVTYGAVNHNDSGQTASAGTNFTLLGAGTTVISGAPVQHQAVEWNTNATPNSTVAFAWSGAGQAALVGLEIAKSVTQTVTVTTGIPTAANVPTQAITGGAPSQSITMSAGITSVANVPTQGLTGGSVSQYITAVSIGSNELVPGPASLNLKITVGSIASRANVPSPGASAVIGPTSITSSANVPSPQLNLRIYPPSIVSQAAVPIPKITVVSSRAEWELVVVDNAGNLITYIPRWRNLSFQKVLSQTGVGDAELDLDDVLFLNIGDTNVLDKENVWQIWWNGLLVHAFHNEDVVETRVQEDGTRTVRMSGPGVGKQLRYGVVLPEGYPNWSGGNRDWSWKNKPAMKSWRDLFAAAQARGILTNISPTFTDTNDSNGSLWTDSQNLTAEPGENLLDALGRLVEAAGADWLMKPNGQLDAAMSYGVHRETTVQFQVAHDQVAFTRNRTRKDLRNIMYVESADLDIGDNTDFLSGVLWGKRELYSKSSTASDRAAATAFAQKMLPLYRDEVTQVDLTVIPDHQDRVVFFDYDVGDWVGVTSDDPRVNSPYPQLFTDGSTTSGSATLTSASAGFTTGDVGRVLSGTNIPYGTTVLAYISGTQVTMSANASGTGTNQTFTIVRPAGYRVLSISGSIDENGMSTIVLGTQSLIQLQAEKLRKAVEAGGGAGSMTIGSGSSTATSSGSPAQNIEGATRQATVPPPVNLAFAGGANENNIYVDIGWSAGIEPAGSRDPVLEFEVQIVPTLDPTKRRVVRTRDQAVRISGLDPNTAYVVTVQSITRLGRTSVYLGGPGTGGDFISGQDNTVPAIATGVAIYAAIRSVTVTWNENADVDVANGNGAYDVQIDDNIAFSGINGRLQGKRTSGTIVSFTNLTPPTNQSDPAISYYARIRPVDASGNTPSAGGPNNDGWSAIAGPSTAGRIDTVDIGTSAITAPLIRAGEINTDHIVAAGLDAAVIKFGVMSGDRIDVNTLDAGAIKSGSVLTATLTVTGLLQAGLTAYPGPYHYWTADGAAFRFVQGGTGPFVGGTEQMRFDVATGSITLAGNITSFATISGGTLQGATVRAGAGTPGGTANPRIVLDSTGLTAYNSGGTAVTTIAASGGSAGKITSSSVDVTGDMTLIGSGAFKTAASPAKRIEISSSTGNVINFFTGDVQETVGWNGIIRTYESSGVGGYRAPLLELNTGRFNNQGETVIILQGGWLNNQGPRVTINNPTYIVNGSGLNVDGYTYIDDTLEVLGAVYCNGVISSGVVEANKARIGSHPVHGAAYPAFWNLNNVGGGDYGLLVGDDRNTYVNGFNFLYFRNQNTTKMSLSGSEFLVSDGGSSLRTQLYKFDQIGDWTTAALLITGGGGGTGCKISFWSQGNAPIFKQWLGDFECRNLADTGYTIIRASAFNPSRSAFKQGVQAATKRLPKAERKARIKNVRSVHYQWKEPTYHCADCVGTGRKAANANLTGEERAAAADEPCPNCGGDPTKAPASWAKGQESGWYGFLVDEIVEQFPEVVGWKEYESGVEPVAEAIDVMGLVALLWEEVKDLEDRLNGLEAKKSGKTE